MIGIIGALEEEVASLQEAMEQKQIFNQTARAFHRGKLWGQEVVVVCSGVGKVNASICAQILIDTFHVDSLLNVGVAGALDPAVQIQDLVVSTDIVQHDMDASAFGDPPGQVPGMDVLAFPADPGLVAQVVAAGEKANPGQSVFAGRIASGDQGICSAAEKQRLWQQFHAVCAEMEGAGVAQAAHLNQIPFVVIRAISDQADGQAAVDYPTFKERAIIQLNGLLHEFLLGVHS